MKKNKKPTPTWFKPRKYLHFDVPLSYICIKKRVENPESVAQWQFFPFLRVNLITEKAFNQDSVLLKKRKERCIRYASHADTHLYAYYTHLLSFHYEQIISQLNLSENVLAFRKIKTDFDCGKCNIHFAQQVFEDILRLSPCCVLTFDVKSFFDNLNHTLLKEQWKKTLKVDKLPSDHFAIYRSLTKYSDIDRDSVFKYFNITRSSKKNGIYSLCTSEEFRHFIKETSYLCRNKENKGIPQGSPISGLLSNIYMLEFDKEVNRLAKFFRAKYYRYCDDIIIVCENEYKLFFKNYISCCIQKLSLGLSREKTTQSYFTKENGIVDCDKPLQYLGFIYNGKGVYIRSSSYTRYLRKSRRAVSLAFQTARKRNKERLLLGSSPQQLYEKKLYRRYSLLGRKTFPTYAFRASKIMEQKSIRKQIKPLWKKLNSEIDKANKKLLKQ